MLEENVPGFCQVESAVFKLKASSVAYRNWQDALAVRTALQQAGYQATPEFFKVKECIQYWHTAWMKEVSEVKVNLPDNLLFKVQDIVKRTKDDQNKRTSS